MKILVIDDSAIHQAAARKQLADHDLTVVGSYDEGQALLGKYDFEVVLVDLLMPASSQSLGRNTHLAGQEMPVGIFLALLAAKNGAKFVAVFTDSDHHSHPASACFDAFNKGKYTPLTVENAKVLLINNPNWVQNDESVPAQEVEQVRLDGSRHIDKIYPRIKRWDHVLKYLLKSEVA